MPSEDIALLCDRERVPDAGMRLALALYLPLGAALAVSRLVLLTAITAAARLLPRRRRDLFGAFLTVAGFGRSWRGVDPSRLPADRPLVIAYNHVSLYDALILAELPDVAILAGDPAKNASRVNAMVMGAITRCFGHDVRQISSSRAFVRMLRDWQDEPAPRRLCVAPEGTVGNGRGLFAFEKGLIGLGVDVVPLALRVATVPRVSLHPILAHHGLNYLWPLLLPSTRFVAEMLPPMAMLPDERPQAFAERVQRRLADHLGVPATALGRADKARYRAALKMGGAAP